MFQRHEYREGVSTRKRGGVVYLTNSGTQSQHVISGAMHRGKYGFVAYAALVAVGVAVIAITTLIGLMNLKFIGPNYATDYYYQIWHAGEKLMLTPSEFGDYLDRLGPGMHYGYDFDPYAVTREYWGGWAAVRNIACGLAFLLCIVQVYQCGIVIAENTSAFVGSLRAKFSRIPADVALVSAKSIRFVAIREYLAGVADEEARMLKRQGDTSLVPPTALDLHKLFYRSLVQHTELGKQIDPYVSEFLLKTSKVAANMVRAQKSDEPKIKQFEEQSAQAIKRSTALLEPVAIALLDAFYGKQLNVEHTCSELQADIDELTPYQRVNLQVA